MTVEKRAADAVLRRLRAPLNGLSGLLQLLGSTRLTPEQRQYVSMLRSSVTQLAVLVEDGVELHERTASVVGDFSPAAVFEAVRDAFLASAHARTVDIKMTVDEGVPETVTGDSVVFRQLVFAAIERVFAAANARVEAKVSWTGNRLLLEAYGDGRGSADETIVQNPGEIATVFDAEWTAEVLATGVHIATSVPAVESTATPVPPSSVVAMRTSISRHRVAVEPSRILIVEDQGSTRTMIRAILERAGHTVTEAATAEQALTIVERETFDLVVVDLHLPDMHGIDMMRQINVMSTGRRMPAIGISADDSDEALASIQTVGLLGLVRKPPHAERLLSAVAFAIAPRVGLIAEAAGGDPVIDPTAFSDLVGIGGGPFVKRLVRQSLEDAEQCLKDMRSAAMRLDVGAWRESAHALRGVALTVAAARLASTAAAAIARPDRDLLASVRETGERLAALLQEARLALNEKLR